MRSKFGAELFSRNSTTFTHVFLQSFARVAKSCQYCGWRQDALWRTHARTYSCWRRYPRSHVSSSTRRTNPESLWRNTCHFWRWMGTNPTSATIWRTTSVAADACTGFPDPCLYSSCACWNEPGEGTYAATQRRRMVDEDVLLCSPIV
jgi:hypothetical protein